MALAKPRWAEQARPERTLAERAYALIHEAIVAGELAPGERLRIEELANVLEMSMTPIREALHRLEEIGLAEHTPHRGARVTQLSLPDLVDLYAARLALEPLAAERAAESFSAEDAGAARAALDRLARAEGRERVADAWRAHTQFHFAIYRASGSPWMLRLIDPLWQSSQRYRMRVETLRLHLPLREGEHEAILGACVKQRPARARALVWNHLVRTAIEIAEHMGGTVPFALVEVADD